MDKNILLLNSDYEPLSICDLPRAVRLLLLGKVDSIEKGGGTLHSVSATIELPSVMRLTYYRKVYKRDIPLTKRNVIRRDGSTCQYCGKKSINMTVDHVVPSSRGGKDEWSNMVCACPDCNAKKGDKTPSQAGMPLKRKPKRPRYFSFAAARMKEVPVVWKPYLFMS